MAVRRIWMGLMLAVSLWVSCAAPNKQAPPAADPLQSPEYRATLEQVQTLNQRAQEHWQKGERDPAAQLLKQAQPLVQRLLESRRPPLAAFEAASDFDQLYANMLMSNRHFPWARQMFMTDVVRWRNWKPETEDTVRRRKVAEAGVAACDKAMGLSN